MVFRADIPRPLTVASALFAVLLPVSPTFANTVIAGGFVPENRSLTVRTVQVSDSSRTDGAVEVAVIELDNNLPDYEVVLDFSDRYGSGEFVSEVRLEGLEGMLGRGLSEPAGAPLLPGASPGQFVWCPGRQESATLGYKVRVLATFKSGNPEKPSLRVSMPISL
ncbi:MAG: hypothetical protein JWP91_4060 [Fibrobacteres bacterium]|nr:hypothetical protein [Fibrobacterota bacterium]